MNAVQVIVMDMLNSEASNDTKYHMTDALMNWGYIGTGYFEKDDFLNDDLYNFAIDIHYKVMDWSADRFIEIYNAYQTNTPIVIGHDYWSRFCCEELLGLSQLPSSLSEAWDELDIAGQMCDRFVELKAGQKMEIILSLLNENNL